MPDVHGGQTIKGPKTNRKANTGALHNSDISTFDAMEVTPRKQLATGSRKRKKQKKLRTPDYEDDEEELLRLMKWPRRPVAEKFLDEESCPICGDYDDHFGGDCPFLERIPPGEDIGPFYDEVCIKCGKIGEICFVLGARKTIWLSCLR